MKVFKLFSKFALITPALLLIQTGTFCQAPNSGSTVNFALFTTDGAVVNTGISHITGKVGTNNGSSTGFGNVNGGMHDGDGTSSLATTDLLNLYSELNTATATDYPSSLLGNGDTLTAGVYSIAGATTLNLDLYLNAQGNANAVFIFKIDASFSTNANSKVKLINQAMACNVFWKVEGLVDMATGTTMRGTVVANNAGINMNTGDTLEGRALSIAGAISVDGILAYTPTGCGSPILTGSTAPTFGEVGCYGIFSSDGPVENTGITKINGDVGANVGLTTGFDSLFVTGKIHPIPDASTALAAADLLLAYNYLNGLAHDITLLYPAQFGRNLVLTPHTYLLDAATTFTDTLYLNAQGVIDAVFIIKINGALATGSYANVVLTNGTQAKNVYWMVNGAIYIGDYSTFNGTIVSQGGVNLLTGTEISGGVYTGAGAMNTATIVGAADIDTGCVTQVGGPNSIDHLIEQTTISIYPNPFHASTTVSISNIAEHTNCELTLYSALGAEVQRTPIDSQETTLSTNNLPSGMYFYVVRTNGTTIHSGKIISR